MRSWLSISEECLTNTLVFPLQHRLRTLHRRSLPGWRLSASSRVPPGRPLKSDKETLTVAAAPELGGWKALNLRSAGGMVCGHQRTIPYRAFPHESCSYPFRVSRRPCASATASGPARPGCVRTAASAAALACARPGEPTSTTRSIRPGDGSISTVIDLGPGGAATATSRDSSGAELPSSAASFLVSRRRCASTKLAVPPPSDRLLYSARDPAAGHALCVTGKNARLRTRGQPWRRPRESPDSSNKARRGSARAPAPGSLMSSTRSRGIR